MGGDLPDLGDSLELVRRFQAGSREALGTLFLHYEPRLLRIIRAKMRPWLRERVEPEDVLQETLLTATEKAPTSVFDSHAGILRWLSQIAQNRILDKVAYFRAQRRDSAREIRPGGPHDDEAPTPEPQTPSLDSPSQVLQRRELEALVDEHVQALEPAAFREAILQRDYYEASWEEVAQAIGRETAGAAREVHRRAHVKLLSRMGPVLREGFQSG